MKFVNDVNSIHLQYCHDHTCTVNVKEIVSRILYIVIHKGKTSTSASALQE